ncbi:MAG: hypothetical protein KDD19_14010 [Phaeodactylibacter sp.]|nr:hypothetical protein [Phaeodactylibacter sp.]
MGLLPVSPVKHQCRSDFLFSAIDGVFVVAKRKDITLKVWFTEENGFYSFRQVKRSQRKRLCFLGFGLIPQTQFPKMPAGEFRVSTRFQQ